MAEQLTLIDGRDALAVLLVRPNPDDPRRVEAEIQCTGMNRADFARVLYQAALSLRDQGESEAGDD